ncbi:MAG: hypothetical protein AB7L94_06415 [Kofleriaceae bacterium]
MTANELVAYGHTGLLSAARKYHGSFVRARRLAGIPSPGRREPEVIERWDEERIVAEILARERDGEPLAYKQVPTKLADAAVYYFETWKDAIEAAGLDYTRVRRTSAPWTRARIIDALRVGAETKRRGVDAEGPVPPAVWLAARRAFGSVRAALDAADVAPAAVFRRVRLNEKELRAALKQSITDRPRMTLGDMNKSPIGRVVVRRYGSIEKGLATLKLPWKPQPSRRGGRRTAR